MVWHFQTSLSSKRILPTANLRYDTTFELWSASEPINGSLSKLLHDAHKSLSITTASAAADELRNLGERGLAVMDGKEPPEISYLQYWHDPTANAQSLLGVTIGLSEKDMSTISRDLDNALFNGCNVWVTAGGGFSAVHPNPFSKQPTQDQLEGGFPLPLHNVSLKIQR